MLKERCMFVYRYSVNTVSRWDLVVSKHLVKLFINLTIVLLSVWSQKKVLCVCVCMKKYNHVYY